MHEIHLSSYVLHNLIWYTIHNVYLYCFFIRNFRTLFICMFFFCSDVFLFRILFDAFCCCCCVAVKYSVSTNKCKMYSNSIQDRLTIYVEKKKKKKHTKLT